MMGSLENSRKKMKVSVVNTPWGKRWAKVEMQYSRDWFPSFADLWRMIQAISHCEDLKYPNGKGRKMVEEFVRDAVYHGNFEDLERKYQIPKCRSGNK